MTFLGVIQRAFINSFPETDEIYMRKEQKKKKNESVNARVTGTHIFLMPKSIHFNISIFHLSSFYLFCRFQVSYLLFNFTWLYKMLKVSITEYSNQLYSCEHYNVKQQTISKDLIFSSSSTTVRLVMCPSSNLSASLSFSFFFC